ncbi:transcriptional protein SWT1-like isoform X3 [Mytilus californianus]|nr:transcriptional protein SWT1-like isoform X3 [Mytilus californianus]
MRNISRKNIEISKNHERYFMLNILAELERRSCVVDLKYAFWNDTFFNFGALIFIDQDNKVVTLHDLIHYNHRKWFSEINEKVNTNNIEDSTNKMLEKEKESSHSPVVANLSADKKTEKWISTYGDMSNEKETVSDDKYANFLPNMEGQYALCYPRFKERKDVTLESLQAKFGVFPGLSEVRIIPNLIFVRYSIKDSGVQCLEKYSKGLMMRVAEERMKKGSGEDQDYDLILKQTTSDNSVSDSEGSSNIDVPEVLEKLTRMISECQKDIFIVVDTGMLITDLDLVQGLTAHGKPALVFPWVVMQELDFLKKGKTSISSNTIETAKKARSAVQYLYQCFQSSHPRVVGQTPAQARIASEVSDFKAECSDDRILQCCIQYQSNNPDCSVLLLTKDLNLCNKSLINGIKAFPLLEGEQHFDNFKNNNTVEDRISIEDRKERDENLPRIEGLDLLFQTNDIMSQEGLINAEWQHETEKTYDELLQDIKYFTDTKIVKQQYRRLQDKIIDEHNSTWRQVAILPYTSDCFCKNTGKLLGEYAIQKKFLEERHFTVVEVKYSEMHKMREKLKAFIPLAHQTEPKHLRQLKHMIYQNRFPLYFISY